MSGSCRVRGLGRTLTPLVAKLDFEIPDPDEIETDEDWDYICKSCENIVRELFESLHQVKKLVGKWCLLVGLS